MTTTLKRLGCVAMIATTLLLEGCLFGDNVSVSVVPGEGGVVVNITFNSTWLSCVATAAPGGGNGGVYDCAYFTSESLSSFSLSSVQALLFAFFIDPVVIQVPNTVTNVRGTYAHTAGNGSLIVQGPLASVPIDLTRNLAAEPGTSLYIVSVPEAFEVANPTGNYAFTLSMNAPPGTTTIPAKAVITGHVRTQDGQNYYPPVFPCVTDMAQAPGGTITAVGTSTLTLPSAASIPRCQGAQFSFAPATGGPNAIPTLNTWALATLALLLGGAALARSRRRAR